MFLTRIQPRALGSTPGLAIPQLPWAQHHGCGGAGGVGVGVLPTPEYCVWGSYSKTNITIRLQVSNTRILRKTLEAA